MRRRSTAALAALLLAALVPAAPPASGAVPACPTVKRVRVGADAVPLDFARGEDDGSVLFTGLSGQTVTVDTGAGTFPGNCAVQISLRTQAGTRVAGPVCGGTAGRLGPVALTASTTYVVDVVPGPPAPAARQVGVTARGPRSLTPGAAPLP